MAEIVVAGHICVDLVPQLAGPARITPGKLVDVGPLGIRLGGCVANTALALVGLGETVRAHAVVGDDALGAMIADEITRVPGLTADLHTEPGQTTSYSIVIEPHDQDRTFWHHTGANQVFTGDALEAQDAVIAHLGYPPLLPALVADDGAPLVAALRGIRSSGATSSLDLAVVDHSGPMGAVDWPRVFERALSETDIISPSVDDVTSALGERHDAETLAEHLLAQGAAVAALSDGANGLVLAVADAGRLRRAGRALAPLADTWAGARLTMPPVPVADIRSTNGAGDAMTAGLLCAIARGMSPTDAARLAVASAACVLGGERPHAGILTALAEVSS